MLNENKDVILINNLFNGRYISEKNLGHEIINIYQSDNGKFYVYVNPYGNIDKKWDNKIKHILFGRSLPNTKMFKIIAKCEVEKQVLLNTKYGNQAKHEEQKKYIEEDKISYGDVLAYKIFSDNTDSNKYPYFITFEVKNLMRPNKDILLSTAMNNSKDSIILEGIVKISNQSQKLYMRPNDGTTNHRRLLAKINDKDLWHPMVEKVKASCINSNNTKNTVISIIKKEYDEIVVSNLLAHFLKTDRLFWSDFCDRILNIQEIKKENPIIKRETENNIDLFIEAGKHLIVIENKIRAQIGGKKGDNYSQLKKYIDYSINHAKKHNIPKKHVHFYLLRSNYNNEDFSEFNKADVKYKEIKYSALWDIVKKRSGENYFNELKSVIEKHASEFDNDLFDRLKERFVEQILKHRSF